LPTTWSTAWKKRLGLDAGLDRGAAVDDRITRDESRPERAGVVRPVDEAVPRLAVRGDGGDAYGAVLVRLVVWFFDAGRALLDRVRVRLVHIRHLERDVGDSVAVLRVMDRGRRVRVHRTGEHEPGRNR